eukprot:5913984-Pleurochrysis_carterae.AAC.1
MGFNGTSEMGFNVTSEMQQVIVEDSVLRDKDAKKGSGVGRYLEALRVHTEPRAEGIELLK